MLGLLINFKKSFTMVVSKKKTPPECKVMVNGSTLEQNHRFEYLGSIITSDGKCDTEIKGRFGIAKPVSQK